MQKNQSQLQALLHCLAEQSGEQASAIERGFYPDNTVISRFPNLVAEIYALTTIIHRSQDQKETKE